MSKTFTLSHFTAIMPGRDGDVLLVNSFMGSLAKVPAERADVVLRAAEGPLLDDDVDADLKLLVDHGYFVDSDLDELPAVRGLLARERAGNGQELIVMPHENCNFRCVYCYETFARGKMAPEVAEGLERLVRSEVADWGRLHVSWFGGEPLLAKDLVLDLSRSFVRSCGEAGVNYSAAMTTNAFFLTPDVAPDLIEFGTRFFQVTVDGPAHEHDARRHLAGGGASYDRVMANLLALKETDLDFTVRVRVNYDPASLRSLAPWVEGELAPAFAHDDRFHLAFHPIGRWGGPNDADLDVCSETDGWQVRNELYEASSRAGFKPASFRSYLASHGSTCYAGRESSIVIGSDGRLYKCTVAFDDPRNHVGWLRPDGRLDIDEPAFRRWVDTDHLDTGKCDACWFHSSCQSRACPLVAMDDGTPPCPSQQEEMLQIVQIAAYGEHVHRLVPVQAAAQPIA